MGKHLIFVAGLLMVLGFASPVEASAVIVNQTLDLTQPPTLPGPGFQGWQGDPAFNGGFNVAVAEGDTFELTIDFLGSQTLTLTNATSLYALVYANVSSDVEAQGTFSFLDSSGTAFLTSDLLTTVDGNSQLGQQFNSSEFSGGLPSSITFYGIQYKATVLDYLQNGVTSRDYNEAAFYFFADGSEIGGITPVPEPASLGLWGLSVFGYALTRRRRGNR